MRGDSNTPANIQLIARSRYHRPLTVEEPGLLQLGAKSVLPRCFASQFSDAHVQKKTDKIIKGDIITYLNLNIARFLPTFLSQLHTWLDGML